MFVKNQKIFENKIDIAVSQVVFCTLGNLSPLFRPVWNQIPFQPKIFVLFVAKQLENIKVSAILEWNSISAEDLFEVLYVY